MFVIHTINACTNAHISILFHIFRTYMTHFSLLLSECLLFVCSHPVFPSLLHCPSVQVVRYCQDFQENQGLLSHLRNINEKEQLKK